ncbi:hypothetical protein H6G33_09670 [Calothrix sp. FACHB-1219]|uniref:hypothetical protein n=1 Tax=unclassified Calothrix TaxID=2619626 RepID=UPI0016826FA5|nr:MULTISPECIES: hypothetical protein [unclassified Calothrix]MBD2201615.1 hypothetical protein [Calothrix sp. FACHB-168]MBD2217301.1 hypothetical protein [Calothrix sp. FACHB-1219]
MSTLNTADLAYSNCNSISAIGIDIEIETLRAQLAAAQARIAELEAEVEQLSTNPNFNTLNRVAGLNKAKAAIREDRRRKPNGTITLVTIDIGGMGNSNSSRGEIATNEAMTELLEEIRTSFRSGDIHLLTDGQLNSGDEFLFWLSVDVGDISGIIGRLDTMSKKHGFEGAYCGHVQVEGSPSTIDELGLIANQGMEQVYPVKKQIKAAKKLAVKKSILWRGFR